MYTADTEKKAIQETVSVRENRTLFGLRSDYEHTMFVYRDQERLPCSIRFSEYERIYRLFILKCSRKIITIILMDLYEQPLIDSPPEFDDPRRDIDLTVLSMQAYEDAADGSNHNNNNNTLSGYAGLQTAEKNKKGFAYREVKAADATRTGYHIAGAPNITALFKHAVRTVLLKNCHITVSDITIAQAIYGPSTSIR